MEFPIKGVLNGIDIVILRADADDVKLDASPVADAPIDGDGIDPSAVRAVDRLKTFGGPRSPIDTDRPVALFLAGAALRMTIANARAACLARYGEKRTPSPAAISRYWARLRRA